MGIELFDALLVAVGEGVHYVTATYSGVYTSVDDGISWSRADLYFGGDSSPGGIAATDSTVLVGNPNGGLYRSTNKGVDWETIAGVVGDTYFRCLSFIDGTVVAPSVYGEIFVSTNKGDDWTEASEGLPAVDVNSIAVYDSFVYLGTKSNGVWRRPQGEFVPLAEDDEEEPIIFTYALRQNYPNPFNGRTIISFEIGNPGFVELTVYDVLGQKLQTLLSGDLAAGLHEASLDGGRLSSGVYLYRLKAGDFVQTRKLVLQR